ncbi:hypothetical protein F6X68_09935 [Micromonospora sp. AMSO12t]|uniref:DHH family phosphoesterase n=1 Tax=Micromonospora sp. AMSO12t TaxID=2650410 RepID=UPI00124B4EE2|nr:DHH family phosphoesterase [Micromonospora sp. AMSO12t]KAB1159037.1 hypothetical protein F6X68_09935 [Micromonospora sp. AMSO12t]
MRAVTSYPDPDTDGVASALGYCALVPGTVPVLSGTFNPETIFVLRELGMACPLGGSLANAVEVVLVDTHDVRQLPDGFPFDRVVEIIDHHPSGDVDAFPQASIQNEAVGAAATLVAERCLRAPWVLSPEVAAALACGIASNTLDFRASSVHERDQVAYAALGCIASPHFNLTAIVAGMMVARGALLAGPTAIVIDRDRKRFATSAGDVLISQVEAPHAATLLERPDLLDELRAAAARHGVDVALLNLVDLYLGVSVLVSTSPAVWLALAPIPLTKVSGQVAWAKEVLLRKTHLVPLLGIP